MEAIRCETLYDGALERIILARPKANVLDTAAVTAIRDRIDALSGRRELKLVAFDSDGPHFSFGASVQEHLPAQVEEMLPTFHALFRELEALSVPTAAAVRGQCLGGAAELACWCGTVFCTPEARIGVPEIKLGVFPPIAALNWRWRVGGSRATRLVTTGEALSGEEAVRIGLADACEPDPTAALKAWFEATLAPLSAASLRFAWRAARQPMVRALSEELPELEQLYLGDLMTYTDPVEGLTAFLEKREPHWSGV